MAGVGDGNADKPWKGQASNTNGNTDIRAGEIGHHGSIDSSLVAMGSKVVINGNVSFISYGRRPGAADAGSTVADPYDIVTLADDSWPSDAPKEEGDMPNMPPLKPVAVVYCERFNFRVCFQNGSTIYEGSHVEGKWTITATIEAPDARENSPLAAVSYDRGSKVHLFYITKRNIVHELCWSANRGWYPGSLTTQALLVSPYSSLSATCSARTINVYCQRGSTVCELSYNIYPPKWWFRELEEGLRGTYITSTSYPGENHTIYHVYFQDKYLVLREYIYEQQDELESDFPDLDLPAYTPITAISWYVHEPYLRLYYPSNDGHIREVSRDEDDDWSEPLDLTASQKVGKDTQIAALQQNDGQLIKIYHILSTEEVAQTTLSNTQEDTPETTTVLHVE